MTIVEPEVRETLLALTASSRGLTDNVRGLTEAVRDLVGDGQRTHAILRDLTEAIRHLAGEGQVTRADLAEGMHALREENRRTSEAIHALVVRLDALITRRGNGQESP